MDAKNNQGERQDKKKDFLRLDLSQPEKELNSETYKVIAEIWLKTPEKHGQYRVKITVDGNLWQQEEFFKLNRQGCLTATITNLVPGSHTIVAATEDGQYRNIKCCNIPIIEKRKKVPANRKIELAGDYGNFRLFITVSTEDGNIFPGQLIAITQQANGEIKSRLLRRTDKAGKVAVKLSFSENERLVTVNFPGADGKLQTWEKRLFGPIPKGGI